MDTKERVAFVPEPQADELLQIIFTYVARIPHERNLDNLLLLLADMGRKLIVCDSCTLWLLDTKRGMLWSKVSHSLARVEISVNAGIAGLVARTGHPILLNDPYNDSRFDQEVDRQSGYRTRNMIAIPLMDNTGTVMGVLQAVNKMTTAGLFTDQDMMRLQLAATYTAVELESAILHEELETTLKEIVFTLAETCEMRSKETGNHVKRVAEFSQHIALRYGMPDPQAKLLKLASPLHDIGKIAIPDSILLKNGILTPDERTVMKTHTTLGYEILRHSERPTFKAASVVALTHHEWWNGAGYPQGLSGEDIPLFGRITAIADVYDALSSERIYKSAWPEDKIVAYFAEQSGTQFEPALVDVFLEHHDDMVRIKQELAD